MQLFGQHEEQEGEEEAFLETGAADADDDGDGEDDGPDDNEDVEMDGAIATVSKKHRTRKGKATLSSANGAPTGQLSSDVFALVHDPSYAKVDLPSHLTSDSRAAEWRSLLYNGFSLLFHGFGSKRALLRQFASSLGTWGQVLCLDGCTARSGLRDLLIRILDQVLQLPVPAGSNTVLLAHIRRAFSDGAVTGSEASTVSRPSGAANSAALRSVLRLLPTTTLASSPASAPVVSGTESGHTDPEAVSGAGTSALETATDDASPVAARALGGATPLAEKAPAQAEAAAATLSAAQKAPNAGTGTSVARARQPRTRESRSLEPSSGWCVDGQMRAEEVEAEELELLCHRSSKRLRRQYDEQRLKEDEFGRLAPPTASRASSAPPGAPRRVPSVVHIVVHSIDGVALRNEAAQGVLAALAALPQVRLVASCSHRNAAAIWDAQQARQFNWAWVEANTAAPFVAEAADDMHTLLAKLQDESESTEGRSAQLVLSALTVNAQKVFRELLQYQLDEPSSPGLPFPTLFNRCKSKLITTSEVSLKGYITEFVDHHLVRTRRGHAGRQCYYSTLPRSLAQQLMTSS